MLGTRYEEYINFEEDLPFKFNLNIKITPLSYSHEANWHENIELQFCTGGEGHVLMDTKKYSFCNKEICIVNSNVIHHTNTEKEITYDCLILDTNFAKKAGIDVTGLNFTPVAKSEKLWQLYEKLLTIYKNTDDVCKIAKLNRTILEILIYIRENLCESTNIKTNNNKSFETIKKAIYYIRGNYSQKLTLDKIAENVYVDKYTLSREFKKITNQTVVEYINSYRSKKAMDYILWGKSVSESARLCGFTNMSFFTKTFKKYIGCLPHTIKNQK